MLDPIRLLVTKSQRLINETRDGLPSDATVSANDSSRRVAKANLPTVIMLDFNSFWPSFQTEYQTLNIELSGKFYYLSCKLMDAALNVLVGVIPKDK